MMWYDIQVKTFINSYFSFFFPLLFCEEKSRERNCMVFEFHGVEYNVRQWNDSIWDDVEERKKEIYKRKEKI